MQLRHFLFALLLVLFAASGCIFSPDDSGDDDLPPPPSFEPAESPDEVMAKFREIYQAKNLDFYRRLLSEDYRFIPQNDGPVYNLDNELSVHEKMFNEIAGEGGVIISDISVVQLLPQGIWEDTPENEPDFGGGSQKRTYIVQIDFSLQGQSLILRVEGPVIYYVRAEQADGQTVYRLLGMRDATFGG